MSPKTLKQKYVCFKKVHSENKFFTALQFADKLVVAQFLDHRVYSNSLVGARRR